MERALPILISLLVGAAVSVQGPINTMLARYVGQWRAVLFSVVISVLVVLVIVALTRPTGSYGTLPRVPRWALVGGTLGVIALSGTVFAVPRIGTAATTALVVASQLITAALIDQFGWLGVSVRVLTPGKLAGLALLALAVGLVVRG